MLKNSIEHNTNLNFFFSFQLSSPFISVYINKSSFSIDVADPSREGRTRDNSWLQFNRLFN